MHLYTFYVGNYVDTEGFLDFIEQCLYNLIISSCYDIAINLE